MPTPSISRQAVVVIHGIGEQRPMDTLRDFVKSVAPPNKNPDKPAVFSKPDQFSDSFELRRLTANRQQSTFKTDYFEFYWANLMEGTELKDVLWWIWNMFVRLPSRIPKRLRGVYYVFWITLFTALTLFALIFFKGENVLPDRWKPVFSGPWFKPVASALVTLITGLINGLLLNYLGDAVRYFTNRPRNVGERQAIRTAGITLLRRLHEAKRSNGENLYDRIMVVGHSLGSVIAYDLLCFFWNEQHTKLNLDPAQIDKAEASSSAFRAGTMSLDDYRQGQFDFWQSQQKQADAWRISDLITAGSPLAFADLYLADGPANLEQKQREREFPTCPPATEPPTEKQKQKLKDKTKRDWFSYPASDDGSKRTVHHAAPFSMTRWTNLYFTNDYVGGSVTCFGQGVENNRFVSKRHGWFPFLSHTHYWDVNEPQSLSRLREKLQLTFASFGLAEEKTATALEEDE